MEGKEGLIQADHFIEQAMASAHCGAHQEAVAAYQQAIFLYGEAGHGHLSTTAQLWYDLSLLHQDMGDYVSALQSLRQSLALFRSLGPTHQLGQAKVLQHIGALLQEEGEESRALEHQLEGLALLRQLPETEAVPFLMAGLKQLGSIHYERGAFPSAIGYFEEALALSSKGRKPDFLKLEAAAIATLTAAIYLEEKEKGRVEQPLLKARQLLAMAGEQLNALDEEDSLVMKRAEEIGRLKAILQTISQK